MNLSIQKKALVCAVEAARSAGALMQKKLGAAKKINEQSQHDIKLELDVRCQKLIEKILLSAFPQAAILGEEGVSGADDAELRWVIDPIDGTVNFTYGIPHACVSIALQKKITSRKTQNANYTSLVGVVYDPFCDELWTAIRGEPARLNGKKIHASRRGKLNEAIVAIGFAKQRESLQKNLPVFNNLIHRVRKVRIMGSAALALTYVASGRFDGYIESGIRLWDIAAGGLILESAGGDFFHQAIDDDHGYRMVANNGLLRKKLEKIARSR